MELLLPFGNLIENKKIPFENYVSQNNIYPAI